MKNTLHEPEIEPPEFAATVRTVEGVPVVEVTGELDLATVPQLLDAISRAGSQLDGLVLAVVDLREAQFIDATGASTLLEEVRAMHRLGGELRLIVPWKGPVAHVLELLEVEQEVDVYHYLDLSPVGKAS